MTDFSIIIPCYNAVKTLQATLNSMQAQTCGDWEVICVDDGSTDGTQALVQAAGAQDARIRLVQNDGKGPSRARNYGAMQFANSEIIAFCDADDIWMPNKLRELAHCFEDTETDAVFGKVAFFKETPDDATSVSTVPTKPLNVQMLLGENPVCTMSNISVRLDTFLRTGGFDEEMVHNEDLEWLIRLVATGAKTVGFESLQVWYRTSSYGLSANLHAMQKGRLDAIKTAAKLGFKPDAVSEAIFLRYLCRRALRLGQGRFLPLSFAVQGLLASPRGFFNVPKRGIFTLTGSLMMPFLPARAAQSLFSR